MRDIGDRHREREEGLRGERQAKPQGNFWAVFGEKYRGSGLTA